VYFHPTCVCNNEVSSILVKQILGVLSKKIVHFYDLIWSTIGRYKLKGIVLRLLEENWRHVSIIANDSCIILTNSQRYKLCCLENSNKPIFFKCFAKRVWQAQNNLESHLGFRLFPSTHTSFRQ